MLADIYVQQGEKFNELITKYCVIFNNDMLKECSNKLLKKLEKKQDINNSILKKLEIWLKLEKEEKNSKFITQLRDWYFEERCEKYISKIDKKKTILDIFSCMEIYDSNQIKKKNLQQIKLDLILFEFENSMEVINNITNILDESYKNMEFFGKIDINLKYKKSSKKQIVVSDKHGIIANKDLYTGEISKIYKCYKDDGTIVYEESVIEVDISSYKKANIQDIDCYGKFYYLKDGTRPFVDENGNNIEKRRMFEFLMDNTEIEF